MVQCWGNPATVDGGQPIAPRAVFRHDPVVRSQADPVHSNASIPILLLHKPFGDPPEIPTWVHHAALPVLVRHVRWREFLLGAVFQCTLVHGIHVIHVEVEHCPHVHELSACSADHEAWIADAQDHVVDPAWDLVLGTVDLLCVECLFQKVDLPLRILNEEIGAHGVEAFGAVGVECCVHGQGVLQISGAGKIATVSFDANGCFLVSELCARHPRLFSLWVGQPQNFSMWLPKRDLHLRPDGKNDLHYQLHEHYWLDLSRYSELTPMREPVSIAIQALFFSPPPPTPNSNSTSTTMNTRSNASSLLFLPGGSCSQAVFGTDKVVRTLHDVDGTTRIISTVEIIGPT